MKAAVVGHVEWVEFARVEAMPQSGQIAQADQTWEQAGGGGAVAALQLARLGAETHLYTSLGDDELGRRAAAELEAAGIQVHAATRPEPTRRAICHVDADGERTITVLGRKLVPHGGDGDLPWEELDGAAVGLFVSGDAEAARQSRRAKVLVATTRELPTLAAAAVPLDAVAGSGEDERERYALGDLHPAPALTVSTAGSLGGWAQPGGPYAAVAPDGPIVDAYGCGDCFLAGLAYGLGSGLEPAGAIALAARCGAGALTGRGVHAAAVRL